MRVVQVVCSDGYGGVERYLLNLGRGLAVQGIDVVIVGGAGSEMRGAADGFGTWLPGDSPWQAWASLRSLGHADIVNTHMSQADVVGCVHRLTGHRTRLVSTRHFAATRGSSALARGVLRPLARAFSAQIAISRFVGAAVEDDSVVVHSGVESRDPVDDARRERIVLVAQRLEPEKDTATALHAWGASTARRRGWRLQIAGAGSQRALLEAQTRALGLDGEVEFLGFREDVDELVARAGLVLAPTPREGLGILVLEAMAAGTPVVAAASGGHLETIGAAAPDLIFPPQDAAAAARIIDSLVDDPLRRLEAGAAVRRAQREGFTIERQVAGTLAVYREVLGA
ncbi:glycosyltransferase family 4 protein [Microbacterium xylanilyticum]